MMCLHPSKAGLLIASILFGVSANVNAQDTLSINPIYSCAAGPLDFSDVKQVTLLDDTDNASAILAQISSEIFNTPDHQVLVSKGKNLKNAIATRDAFSGKGRIIYDEKFLVDLEKDSNNFWATRAILAHELAHLKLDHLATARQTCDVRPETCEEELGADAIAGRVLARLGASKESVRAVFETLGAGGNTHPSKLNRIAAAKSAWMDEKTKQIYERAGLKKETIQLAMKFLPDGGSVPASISYAHEFPYGPLSSFHIGSQKSLNTYIQFENHQHKALISIEEEEARFEESPGTASAIELCLINQPDSTNLELNCSFDGGCEISRPKAYFHKCPDEQPAAAFQFSLFSKAWADPIEDEKQAMPAGWNAPSLEMLQYDNDQTRGFTHFKITSESLPSIQNAAWIALGVTANGYPIYFGGMNPKYNAIPYTPGDNLKLEFGLETLAFRGEDSGVEHLRADIYFLDARGNTLETYTLNRDYVALRPAETTEHEIKGQPVFWSGDFVHSRGDLEYTVTLASAKQTRLKYVNYEAGYTTQQHVEFDAETSRQLVAVVRPPLGDNPNYGIVAGLQDSTRKIQFTFNKADALELCRWLSEKKVQSDFKKKLRYVRPDSLYLYEMGTGKNYECG